MSDPFDPAEIKKEIEKIVITPECLTTEELEVFPFIQESRSVHIDQCKTCQETIRLLIPTEEEVKSRLELAYQEALSAASKALVCTTKDLETELNKKEDGPKVTWECLSMYEVDLLPFISETRLKHVNQCEFCKKAIKTLSVTKEEIEEILRFFGKSTR